MKAWFNVLGQGAKKADVFLLPFRGKVAADAPSGIHHTGPRGLGKRVKLDLPMICRCRVPSGIVQIEQIGRRRLIDRVHAPLLRHGQLAGFILICNAVPPRQPRGCHLIIQCDRGLRKVIKQGFQLFVKERKPVFDTLMFASCAHSLVERIIRARGAKLDPVVLAEAGNGSLVQNDLRHRGQFDQVQLFSRALCRGIKPARTIQNITKKIQPHRPRFTRWKDVDDAAPDRIIAGFHHRRALRKPHANQKLAQGFFINSVIHSRRERGLTQGASRRNPLACCIDRGQENKFAWHLLDEGRQGRHARRRNIGIGRDPIIRQTVPARKDKDRHLGRKEGQRCPHRLHPLVIAGHMQHRTAGLLHFLQDQPGIIPFGGTAHGNRMLRHAVRFLFDFYSARRDLPKGPNPKVLIHAPHRRDEDEDHADELYRKPTGGKAAIKRFFPQLLQVD